MSLTRHFVSSFFSPLFFGSASGNVVFAFLLFASRFCEVLFLLGALVGRMVQSCVHPHNLDDS